MWIILDAAVVAILIFSVVRGYRKGLVKTAFKLGIVIVSLILAYSIGPAVSSYLQSTSQYAKISQTIQDNVTEKLGFELQPSEQEAPSAEQSAGSESDAFENALSSLGIDLGEIKKSYDERVSAGVQSASDAISELVVQPVAKTLCNALGFIAVFVVSLLVLHIVMYILDAVCKLPLLKSVNKMGGAVCGVVTGIVKVFVFCTIVEMLLPYIQNTGIGIYCGMESKTLVYNIFMNCNPLSFLY